MQYTSTANLMIKSLRALRTKKGRAEQQRFLIEGTRLVGDALADGVRPEQVLYDPARPAAVTVAEEARGRGIRVDEASEKVISALSDTEMPQGVVAVCPYFELPYAPQAAPGELILALDGLQDPGNIGTIIRTAEAAGVSAIYVSRGAVQKYNPKLIRATMGAFFRLPMFFDCDLPAVLTQLHDTGYRVLASALEGEDFYSRTPDAAAKALIIGSEANGVSGEALARADRTYRLPITGRAESLNAAIAAGILIYDLKMRG